MTMTDTSLLRRPRLWVWAALCLVATLVAALAIVVLSPAERALSAGATAVNASVEDAYELEIAASVFEGDTGGMLAGQGDGSAGGQRVWFRWRPSNADRPSLAGTAYLVYDGGDAVPAAVELRTGPSPAAISDLGEVIAPTASDPATGGYEFELPSLAPDEFFYVGVETAESGTFRMTFWQPTAGGPANDALVSAESLELVVNAHLDESGFTLASGTTSTATFEVDDSVPEPQTSVPGGSVWYSWTVPQTGGRLDVAVDSGDVALHVYQRPAADSSGATVEGLEAPLGSGTGTSATATTSDDSAAGQFDPANLLPRDDLVVDGVARITGDAGDAFLLQVVGSDDFVLVGTVSGIVPPDLVAPTASCTSPAPTGGADWVRTWVDGTETPAEIECTVTDDRGLLAPAEDWYEAVSDAEGRVTLTATTPDGTAAADVRAELRLVCDLADNCVQVGIGVTVQIDNAPPTLSCDPAPSGWLYGTAASTPVGTVEDRIACEASDAASGLADAGDRAFDLVAAIDASTPVEDAAVAYTGRPEVCDAVGNCVTVPTPTAAKLDRKPPTAVCAELVVPERGWFATNATVECAVSDAGSGLANAAQSTMTIATDVGAGAVDPAATSARVEVCDVVGNCVELPRLTGVPVDRAAPVVACEPAPSWSRGAELELRCTATDQADGSGLAEPSADADFRVTLGIEPGTERSGLAAEPRQICDIAGNCAPLPPLAGLGLDDLAPVVECAPSPTGWLRTDAVVACTAVDGGSGLADPADAAFDLRTDFTGTTSDHVAFVAGKPEICDAVGNCAPVPTPEPVRIDRVDPVADCVKPVDGAYDFNLTIACTASDAGAGLAEGATLDFILRTSVEPGTSATGAATNAREVCDLAGNCVTFGPYGAYDIDLTSPPASAAPAIVAPRAVSVLAAVPGEGFRGVRAPFAPPTVDSEIGAVLECVPDGTGLYPLGTTEVECAARDAADRVTVASFDVRVALAPELAAPSAFPIDRPIAVAGSGFDGPVEVLIGGVRVATLTPSGGAVAADVDLPPATSVGAQTLVLRGTGLDGEPRMIITPIIVTTAAGPGDTGSGGDDEGEGEGSGSGGDGGDDGASSGGDDEAEGPGDDEAPGGDEGSGGDEGAGDDGDTGEGGTGGTPSAPATGAPTTGGAGTTPRAPSTGDPGSAAPQAAAGERQSPAARAAELERGYVLDPQRWPSEEFKDGGEVRDDDGAAAPVEEVDPASIWWAVSIGAVVIVLLSAGIAFLVHRRRLR